VQVFLRVVLAGKCVLFSQNNRKLFLRILKIIHERLDILASTTVEIFDSFLQLSKIHFIWIFHDVNKSIEFVNFL